MDIKKKIISVLLVIVLIFSQVSVFAEDEVNTLPSGIPNEDIGTNIEAFINSYKDFTTGVSLAVISGNETIYKNNYGKLDVENNISVDNNSVFEWGSVSKILVWISVMQLEEKGLINLNTDIRKYLPKNFLTKLNYKKPITMKNLMNHNAGWQEILAAGLIEEVGEKPQDLLTILKESEPVQVFEPGKVCAYSNWGTTLAAAIVERVSGQKYHKYVQKNILNPLGMKNTAVLNDLSDNLWVQNQMKLNKGYYFKLDANGGIVFDENGKPIFEEVPRYQIKLYPCGSVASTLDDFIKLAKFFTKESNYDRKIFKKGSTMKKFLSSTLNYADSDTARICHGLWTIECKNQIKGHHGNTLINSSGLFFDTESNTAYVVMANQYGESIYNYGLFNYIFGSISQRGNPNTEAFVDANILSDRYVYCRSIFEKPEYIEQSTFDVTVVDNNNFVLQGLLYTQQEPNLFVSQGMNISNYIDVNDDGSTIINSYTCDVIDEEVFSKMLEGVKFEDFNNCSYWDFYKFKEYQCRPWNQADINKNIFKNRPFKLIK